jgi:hypothetical protein
MKPIDICYTPLDIPEPPQIDMQKLFDWMEFSRQQVQCDLGKVIKDTMGDRYPWVPAFPYSAKHGGWICDFDNIFPELAKYMTEGYNIELEDLGAITFSPTKDGHTGLGLWHVDQEIYGLRVYLQNEKYDINPLLYRKTIEPSMERPRIKVPMDENDPRFEKTEHVCKMMQERQPFYLNNIRGVHSAFTNEPAKRFAVLIGGKTNKTIVRQKTEDLIVRSAQKFKDYALFY